MMNLSKLHWIKVITDDNKQEWAYTHAMVRNLPKNVVDANGVTIFPLGFRDEKANTPPAGDLMALIQRGKLTHIIELLDEQAYLDGGWYHRIVRVVWWKPENTDWQSLEPQSTFLGFDPTLMDGKPHLIADLKRFSERWDDEGGLDAFQQHLAQQLID